MKLIISSFIGLMSFLISNAQLNKDTMMVFNKVETEAQFPGGDSAWKQFLMKTLNPDNALGAVPKRRKHFSQTAIVKFIVSIDGTLKNITIENNVHPDIEAEALRVIRKSPKWIPAYQNGRRVNAYRRQPISFVFD